MAQVFGDLVATRRSSFKQTRQILLTAFLEHGSANLLGWLCIQCGAANPEVLIDCNLGCVRAYESDAFALRLTIHLIVVLQDS